MSLVIGAVHQQVTSVSSSLHDLTPVTGCFQRTDKHLNQEGKPRKGTWKSKRNIALTDSFNKSICLIENRLIEHRLIEPNLPFFL